MKSVLIPLADGVEEMEAIIVIDTLRRANWNVVSAGLLPGNVTCSRRVRLSPDVAWANITPALFDVLVLPGGREGAKALSKEKQVLETIRNFVQNKKLIAAICAGPLVLQAAGILERQKITCHPSVADKLRHGTQLNRRVVVDGRLITAQGPGTAFEFALTIIREVDGSEKAHKIARAMLVENFDSGGI
mgnify:CR=1 FL=1